VSGVNSTNRSRGAYAPEFCFTTTPRKDLPPTAHDPEKWCPVFGRDHAQKREAKRRKAHANHVRAHRQTSPPADASSAAARHSRGRARLPALHRGTRHRLLPRWLSPRTGFPQGTAYQVFCPFAAQRLELSTLRADRSFCRPTGDPEPPGSGSHSSARGHRIPLRPPKVPSRKAPLVSGIVVRNTNGDDRQAQVSILATL
jgi:hypothetical protein